MAEVIFSYQGNQTVIQCNTNEKMKDICLRFTSKLDINISKVFFLCNGVKLNEDLNFLDINTGKDKTNKIIILVNDINEVIEKEKIILAKEIICPICKDNIFINFHNYKINLTKCKNNHTINNILIKDFKDTQKVDISKIKCDACKKSNKSETYNNEFYSCLKCRINLCPICKYTHDNNHNIINYDYKNYICDVHYDNYIKYCKECNKNICLKCSKKHQNHNNIFYGDILPNENMKDELKEFKNYITKLNNDIQIIIKILNNVITNLDIYYNIYNDIINHYNEKKLNYQTLMNIDEFINYKNKVIKDIANILNEININNKFNKLMNIHHNINFENDINIQKKEQFSLDYEKFYQLKETLKIFKNSYNEERDEEKNMKYLKNTI